MNSSDSPNIPTDTIAETDNYTIWTAVEPDGETTYHLELGQVTVHFFTEEWDEFTEMIDQASEEPVEGENGEEGAVEVELDWGSLYFSRDEWQEFLNLIEQVGE